ncbi:MAG: hypothetical protein KDA72_21345, partial [Planctomycetales bacterium]|nr:hypothetical protein [Planctomycetales bacterium]
DWITLGFRMALARAPSEAELRMSLAFLESQINSRMARKISEPAGDLRCQALADFCQGLFSLNEFIYVD